MFQYLLTANSKEETQTKLNKALEKGIEWIVINNSVSHEVIDYIINFCKINKLILSIRDSYGVLKDKKLHGILFSGYTKDIENVREHLGGHPIIGIIVSPQEKDFSLATIDIDYVVIDINHISEDRLYSYAAQFKLQNKIKLVAMKDSFTKSEMSFLLDNGFDGFVISNI